MRLAGFSIRRPPHETDQARLLEWIAEAHAEAQATLESLTRGERDAFADRMRKVVARHSCSPAQIRRRGHVVDIGRGWDRAPLYDVRRHPHGQGTAARSRLFDEAVSAYFAAEYAHETTPPADLIHVTCTGYLSPSGAQKLVAERGWGHATRVTHAYHMGCYAAFPAIRLALGMLTLPPEDASPAAPRVDIAHTELCSLHFDPATHAPGQLVVQSLFADGFIRYSVLPGARGPGLRVLALDERILPQSASAMSWVVGDFGMTMTLARDVPLRVGGAVRQVVVDLFRRAQLDPGPLFRRTIFAVHPGGPKIIDGVVAALELDEAQVRASRAVLAEHGNMSSATLPHVWSRLLDDASVPTGTPIVSLAFGPGLTVCGGLFRKQ